MKIRLSNIPVPLGHVVPLALAIILQQFRPWMVHPMSWLATAIGWLLIAGGILLAAWTVWEFQDMEFERTTKLITTGPYSFSRNPMYVAWTIIYVGIFLVVNSLWGFAFLPIIVLFTHFVDVLREEQALERKFGREYREYRARVRRYC